MKKSNCVGIDNFLLDCLISKFQIAQLAWEMYRTRTSTAFVNNLGGQFMIQCDYCDIWFHGSCVNVAPSHALDIDKYKSPGCTGPTGLTL